MRAASAAASALVGFSLLFSPLLAEPLAAPQNLSVSTDGTLYRGRWEAVPGASYYEVWTRQYGNWRFNDKDHETTPFTSSFEMAGSDDRTRFKVRAVSADGEKGDFSDETTAVTQSVQPVARPGLPGSTSASNDGFDVEAPAPSPPSSLFTVWTAPREIRLVWQASEKADHYIIEELKDGKWLSVLGAEFPKETTALIKDKPMPGPYQFRVRAIGRNGRASEPSRPTTAKN